MTDEYDQPENLDPAMSKDDLARLGKKWLDRIRDAEKREKEWSDAAAAAEKAYMSGQQSAGEGREYDFNILHANVETIAPSVFNSTPVPDIRERFRMGTETPETAAAMRVAEIIERAITVQADDGALETELEDLTQDALLAGRGIIRIRFDAEQQEISQPPTEMFDETTGQLMLVAQAPQVVMTGEKITFEAVSWRDYRQGPAKRWADVPWLAFRHFLPEEEVKKITDPELKEILSAGGESESTTEEVDTQIWEIWCKQSARVYMIVDHSGDVIKIIDDPMGLDGFFPIPQPVQPLGVVGSLIPLCPFNVYKKLADELELTTKRIAAITTGLKVRGIIAGSADDIRNLADADDNELVPIANLEGFAAAGGLDGAISWWPVQHAITVLRELYISRDQTKNLIYEVTGISDIARGATDPNETLGAQQLKSQWGSLRIRKLQKKVERAARDIFVIAAQLIGAKFSLETLQAMSQVQITPEMAALLQRPLDKYRIDVESDSTVRADLGRRKGEMAEFLQGTASYFATMTPVVQSAPQAMGPVIDIFAAFARQFNLGKQAEDSLEKIVQMAKDQADKPPPPNPEEERVKQEAQVAQIQMQMQAQLEQARLQLDAQKVQQDGQIAMAKLELDRDRMKLDERKAEIEALGKLNDIDRADMDADKEKETENG